MENNQQSKYLELLKLRRRLIGIIFVFPSVVILISMLLRGEEHYILISLPIALIPIGYISIFYFLAKDICPWCGQSFFIGKKMFLFNGLDFLIRKTCVCCGEPKSQNNV